MSPDAALLDLLDREPELLVEVAKRAQAVNESGQDYSDEDVAQIVHAFGGALREALAGTGSDARDLLMQTAVPAVVARGETPATLARSATVFGVLLAGAVRERVPAELTEGAVEWLAGFFGAWAHDVVEAARSAG